MKRSARLPPLSAQGAVGQPRYRAIQESQPLHEQLRIIGAGEGNAAFEIDLLRKTVKITYPLFPEEAFVIHKALSGVSTPFSVIVPLEPSAQGQGAVDWLGLTGTVEGDSGAAEQLNRPVFPVLRDNFVSKKT